MKKVIIVSMGLLFVAVFFLAGKVFAEQVEPEVGSPEASVETSAAPEINNESSSGDEAPIDEELKDEEFVDSEA